MKPFFYLENKYMSKRVRITNDSLNSYGSRVLTSGVNTEQYQRNPVLLYNHRRGDVIGIVKDIRVENNEITGELVFDEATELSVRCKKQFEFGSLRMVSMGISILELSDDKQHLVVGQTRPTVTRSKLFEVSLVDVGANDDAIVLYKDEERITLGKDGECALPLLNNQQPNQQKMEQKELALLLGLPETADEATIRAAILELNAAKAENGTLRTANEALVLAQVGTLVDKAIAEKRIGADRKDQFLSLGKEIGAEKLQKTFEAMSPQVKLSTVIGHHGGAPTGEVATYKKLSDVPVEKWAELRDNSPEEYKRLYEAEYGMACEI